MSAPDGSSPPATSEPIADAAAVAPGDQQSAPQASSAAPADSQAAVVVPDTTTTETEVKDVDKARDAFQRGDVEASRQEHDKHTELHVGGASDYVRGIVFGGLDGIITTLAVVTALAGAGEDWRKMLIFGFANAIADAWSMGFGSYVSGAAELDYAMAEREREKWEVEHNIEGEIEEMVDLYMERGYDRADAERLVAIFSKDPARFVDVMMVEELGMLIDTEDEWKPIKESLVMFTSFILFGLFPILAYLGGKGKGTDYIFGIAVGITGVGLIVLGACKGFLTGKNIPYTSFVMLLQGAISGGVGYGIGALVDYIIGPQKA